MIIHTEILVLIMIHFDDFQSRSLEFIVNVVDLLIERCLERYREVLLAIITLRFVLCPFLPPGEHSIYGCYLVQQKVCHTFLNGLAETHTMF